MSRENISITRRLDNTLNDLQEEFRGFYYKDDFLTAVKALKNAEKTSDYASKLRDLLRMLDACGIPYEKGKPAGYYVELVEGADLPDFKDVEDRMLFAMYSKYDNYPSPEEYMKRLVDRLESREDRWERDTLRLRILKQFIKHGDYLSGAVTGVTKKNGEVTFKRPGGRNYIRQYAADRGCRTNRTEDILNSIDDGIFEVLASADKTQKKLYSIYGILKVADDLANGKFRVWGVTKRDLYLFAMVYGMTYYAGPDSSMTSKDRMTDIGINLFRDYYSNNFIRFITDSYRGRLQEYEQDPSGQGINYKNYAEMVYLYFIAQDIPAAEKISRAHTMIDRIRREMRGTSRDERSAQSDQTERLRDFFVKDTDGYVHSEDIFSLPEEDFEAFLRINYDCDVRKPDGDINPMQLAADQNSAYREYEEVIRNIEECGLSSEDCRYGLWFADPDAFGDTALMDVKGRFEGVDEKRFSEFSELLLGVHNYLTKDTLLKKKAHDEVTRSAIIAAYYYYYNEKHLEDVVCGSEGFGEVFSDFQQGVNRHLERAHYQLFSGRNIFDVLIAFSSYAYIYM